MEEEEQYQECNFDEEALSVLSLFPPRTPSLTSPSLQQYQQLVEGLSCGLCKEVLFCPVLLRCSHRFCKDCLSRYLRAQRRVCPSCRLTISQHYTPRIDQATQALITAAFGDGRRLSKRLREVEQEGPAQPPTAIATATAPVPLELRRAESQSDLRMKQKENAEDVVPIPTALKRTKTTDEDTRPRKKAPSEKKIKFGESERENTPSRRSKLAAQLREIRRENADPPLQRKKRRSVMVIELDSSEPAEVQEVPRPEEPLPPPPPESLLPSLPRLHPSISIIPEVSQMDSARKIISMQDLQQEAVPEAMPMEVEDNSRMEVEAQDEPSVEAAIPQVITEPIEEQPPLLPPEVLAARNALQQQFGSSFLSKVLELCEFPIFMRLLVSRHPMHPFTPNTSFSQLRLLARTAVHSINCVLADDLNLNREAVRLFVSEEGSGGFIEVAASTKLQEINSRFWRSAGGFEIGEFGEYSEMLGEEGERFAASWQNRVLYYCIDYSKIVH